MCEDSIEIIKITNWPRYAAHQMDKAAKLLLRFSFGQRKIELVNCGLVVWLSGLANRK